MNQARHTRPGRDLTIAAALLAFPAFASAAEEGGEHGAAASGPLAALGVDPRTVIVQLLAFLVMFWLFKKFLWGPILGVIEQRQTEVEGVYRDAETVRDEALSARKDYEARLARSEEDARQRINEALQQAAALKDEIIDNARAESDRIIASGEETVRQEAEKAMTTLRDEVARLSVGAASKIVQHELDPETHRMLVEDFISGAGSRN
jgi:F-type H+-transporting ATPase subunit b